MTFEPQQSDHRLIDLYIEGQLSAKEIQQLETKLAEDPALRSYFVSYCSMNTDLHMFSRSSCLANKTLETLFATDSSEANPFVDTPDSIGSQYVSMAIAGDASTAKAGHARWWITIAVSVLTLITVSWFLWLNRMPSNVAWVIDAQNCRWVNQDHSQGQLRSGTSLKIKSGLLRLGFSSQADILVEGPAQFDIISGKQIQLHQGRVAVRMPKGMSGFEVVSPQGKIIDLGTEFGVDVSESGETSVVVFEGQVELVSAKSSGRIKLQQNERALLENQTVKNRSPLTASHGFTRQIVPPPVLKPRSYSVEFSESDKATPAIERGVLDIHGVSVGLPVRLNGTGDRLPAFDPNLEIDPVRGSLKIAATKNDINGQKNLDQGDYIGIRLSSLGFTGTEDFEVKTRITDIPQLEDFGQFGLYVGTSSDRCIRGGMIKWRGNNINHNLFLVNNSDGKDKDANKVGYIYAGSNIELTFRRTNNQYSLKVENLDDETSNTLEIRHPSFLDGETDLQVGLFAANPFRDERAVIAVENFSVTVWTIQDSE